MAAAELTDSKVMYHLSLFQILTKIIFDLFLFELIRKWVIMLRFGVFTFLFKKSSLRWFMIESHEFSELLKGQKRTWKFKLENLKN